jgi:hypothetical protein
LDLEDEDGAEPEVREDPIGLLAEAAGYEDRELWWERQVEQRRNAADLFDAILEAMAALWENYEPPLREARARRTCGVRSEKLSAKATRT